MPRSFLRLALTVMLPAMAASVMAEQPVPDAGRLLQQTTPPPSLPQREEPKIRIEEAPATGAPEGARIHVVRLRITGATLFPAAELHALIADGEGKELSLGDLHALAERLTRYYRNKGYLLARAYLPAQEVKSGEVEIAVLEGNLGEVSVGNPAGLGGAALMPLAQLRPGEAPRDQALERNLLLLSDLPGVEVKSTLKPGATVGASDLLVDVTPGRRMTGSVDLDSFGDRFSGEYRLGSTINLNNPLWLGDQVTLRAMVSNQRMSYFRGSYQLPVNGQGTRLGIAVSDMHYHLGKNLAPLDAKGNAQVGSLYAMHPFVRSRSFNLNGQLQYDHLRLEDRIDAAATVIDKTLNNLSAGFNGDFNDAIGGANNFSANYTSGDLKLDQISRALDAVTARTAGNFSKGNVSWLRLQRLTDATSLYMSAMAQVASKNLDSSQKMSLGGAYGVRAYPQGEAPGDVGNLLTLEARYNLPVSLPSVWQLAAFMDRGHVTLNKDAWTTGLNSRTLTDAGLGLNVAVAQDWFLKGSVAWKVGSERPVSDVDRSPRAWFQAVKNF